MTCSQSKMKMLSCNCLSMSFDIRNCITSCEYGISHICLCVCDTVTFENLDVEKFVFDMQIHLQNLEIKFIYQDHLLKANVTGAKKHWNVLPPLLWQTWCCLTANALMARPVQSFRVWCYLPAASHSRQRCADFIVLIHRLPARCADFEFVIRRQTVHTDCMHRHTQCVSAAICR